MSDHTPSAETSRLARLFFWIFLLLLLAVPVVFAEIYLRTLGLGSPVLYYADFSYRYAPRPDQKLVGRHGAAVTIDSKGLRGTKDWTAPADGKILFMGTSVTWGGTYIDDKDVYSNVVCVDLKKALNRDFTCGNAGVNAYGVDNIAARIRYRDFADESVIVVTLSSNDTIRGLVDINSLPYFVFPPPGPFKALAEATTFLAWRTMNAIRFLQYARTHDLRVAERSLADLFAALRETDRPGRKVLIVMTPDMAQLDGKEGDLTRRVRAVIENSKLDFLDLHQPLSAVAKRDSLYYDNANHLDLDGHQFVGDRIAEKLESLLAERP